MRVALLHPLAGLAACVLLVACGADRSEPDAQPAPAAEASAGIVPPVARNLDDTVVFIVVDTLRADHLPFYGYRRNTAPFLTRLAKESILFRNAHSPSSWTAPASASMFTSVHPFQHHILMGMVESDRLDREFNRIPDSLETLAEVFKANGYTTFAVTDNPNLSAPLGFDVGFDYFRNFSYEGGRVVNEALFEWTDEIRAADKPFVYLHYMDPHHPYRESTPGFPAEPTRDVARLGEIAHWFDFYDSEIRTADRKIKEAFAHFGWHGAGLVVFTSDHGEEFKEHGKVTHANSLYAEVLNVPLFLRSPARWPRGREIEQRVSTLDLLPTLVELLGFEPNPDHEGRSLVPLLDSPVAPAGEPPIYGHLYRYAEADVTDEDYVVRSLIRGNWKLILDASKGAELYDVARDPGEQVNVAGYHPERVREMTAELEAIERDAKPHPEQRSQVVLTPEENERLKALGYTQ